MTTMTPEAFLEEVLVPRWWDGEPMHYGETRTIPTVYSAPRCPQCNKPARTVTLRDLTIFGRQFRPVPLHPRCVARWDAVDL